MEQREHVYEGDWSTVSLTRTPMGLTARERSDRFRLEAMSELVLRLTGGLMVAASTMLWLVLPMESETDQAVSHGLLAALCTAVGLAVYAYGTRGFRRQLSLDAKRGTLALTKINMNDRGRVMRTIGLDEIESLFLRRASTPLAQASLCVRVAGHHTPLLALTGAQAELEHIHRHLCDIVQDSGPRRGFASAPAHGRNPARPTRAARA
ncbi:MAG: hypothetical protein K8F31_00525 [Roseovarius sp.]|nr:hypothetical protein [Roseovarius sp.]